MSSINGIPNLNAPVNGPVGTSAKKGKMFKWIFAIIIVILVLYFFKRSNTNTRNSGESCRYHSDCKNKKCKCKNGSRMCLATNKVCV